MNRDLIAKEAFIGNMVESAADKIGRFRPADVLTAYKSMTVNPLGAAAFNAAIIGVPAYFLAKPIARGLTALHGKVTKQDPAKTRANLALVNKNIGSKKWLLGALAASGAGLFTLMHNYMPKRWAKETGGFNSLFQWDHEPPKGFMSAKEFNEKKDALSRERGFFSKESSDHGRYNSLMDHPGVPVDYSMDLIWEDKFLNGREKINASLPLANAGEGSSGLVSGSDITKGALRAGFGAAAGGLAGFALSSIFSLPQNVTKTMSYTGAIAGALKNTGVF